MKDESMHNQSKRFLKLLDEETIKDNGKSSDRALYLLLKRGEHCLPKLDDYFHKAFRQVDVMEDGYIDSAIWHLLNCSTLFWKVFEQFQGEKKI